MKMPNQISVAIAAGPIANLVALGRPHRSVLPLGIVHMRSTLLLVALAFSVPVPELGLMNPALKITASPTGMMQ
jgi:hypothetical protein